MTKSFTGESASWYTIYSPVELFLSPATGSYSLDSGEPTQFTWQATEDSNWSNQLLFTTPKVTHGPHNLTVTFLGSTGGTPLVLDYLLIQNGATISSNPTEYSMSHPNNHTLPIIVGSVGGLILLAIIIIGYYIQRHRYKWRTYHRDSNRRVSLFHGAGRGDTEAQNTTFPAERRIVEKLKRLDSRDLAEEDSGSDTSDVVGFSENVMLHEDSGARFQSAVEELPPSYSAT